MKTAIIRQRVADFLKRHAPFDTLSEPDLLDLAGGGKVKFHESEEYIFREGDSKGPFTWVVQQGRVDLLERERLSDVVGEGDVLGLEWFAGDGVCRCSARTATDVILYGVATQAFESLIPRYPAVAQFVAARFSVSGTLGFQRTSWLNAPPPPLDFLRARLVTMPAAGGDEQAARLMGESRSGVVALVDGSQAVGTVTPRDLCLRERGPAPPTLAAPMSTRMAVRQMLRTRSEHLGITQDGVVTAILTAAELSLFCGHHPLQLISGIGQAQSREEMRPLLNQATRLALNALAEPADVDDCCRIGGAVIVALAEACIRQAGGDVEAAGIDRPAAPFCWVMFGASARRELARPSVPTIAAVYDDSQGECAPLDSLYFTALAGEVGTRFHQLGIGGQGSYWPEGAQPSMPLSEWKRLYTETIRNPSGHDLYARREFLDLWPLSGDASILQKLQQHILFEMRDHKMAIPLLANDTLVHLPPLAFFRGLVLDLDGGQRESFDIVDTVISPLVEAARVFAIAHGRLTPVNTLERLETAWQDYPGNTAVLREAADAFRIGLYYLTLTGTSRIEPGRLAKFEQVLLKTAFASIQKFLEFTVSTFVPKA